MRGVVPLSRALVRGYQRDRGALFFTILFPLVFLFLLGGLLGNQNTPKVKVVLVGTVGVYDELSTAQQAQLREALTVSRASTLEDALAQVRDGDVEAAIIQSGTDVRVRYSAADASAAAQVQTVVRSLVDAFNISATGQTPKYAMTASQTEDKSLKEIQYLTPGILGWAIATGATFTAASTLVVWRQRGLMRRLTLAPIGVSSVIGARILVSLAIALAQTVLFIAVAVLVFDLRLADTGWLAIPLVLAGTLAFLSIGLLIGATTKSVESASAISNLVVIPMAFLSGSFIQLSIAPKWVQQFSEVLPLRHLNDGMVAALARGADLSVVLPEMGLLLGFALVVAVIAARLFRWDDA
ncbi:ABC transporter permease [Streptomyces sp. WI04-05B]|uniref:ABC transporter permease n=1 Tax=Streptomyces TaxID=1883 RepID=UPI00299FB937|nr:MULTISPECIES: ABC transporter permease [unclassified Streptomyces]MDX2545388.1 ABC transporter permease [Streptomyces sp. WI04-05B]MDX2588117.1 ABC transporter permease [Streptomyces sp. WI04-05A]MDX3749122.1 ABC transporter permease [Streptomyces sp. AK08-02]